MKPSLALKTIDRIVVWILLALFLVFMVSGYMITRGFLNRYYGFLLHTRLDLPIMVFFVIHIAINVRCVLMRRGVADRKPLNVAVLIVGMALFAFIVYLDQFFGL